MATTFSSYKASTKHLTDLWSKVYRFNKSIKIFKYLAVYKFPKLRFRFRFRFRSSRNLRRVISPRSRLSKRVRSRSNIRQFYGRLNERKFRHLYSELGRRTAFSWIEYIFSKLEFRVGAIFYRAGFFTDTIKPLQLHLHGYTHINTIPTISQIKTFRVSDFGLLPYSVCNWRELRLRIQKCKYIAPPRYLLVSHYIPACVVVSYPKINELRFSFDCSPYSLLRKY